MGNCLICKKDRSSSVPKRYWDSGFSAVSIGNVNLCISQFHWNPLANSIRLGYDNWNFGYFSGYRYGDTFYFQTERAMYVRYDGQSAWSWVAFGTQLTTLNVTTTGYTGTIICSLSNELPS